MNLDQPDAAHPLTPHALRNRKAWNDTADTYQERNGAWLTAGGGGVDFPLIQASAEAVPLPDASFDVVFCDHGAMTFADPYRTVPEVARLLRRAVCSPSAMDHRSCRSPGPPMPNTPATDWSSTTSGCTRR